MFVLEPLYLLPTLGAVCLICTIIVFLTPPPKGLSSELKTYLQKTNEMGIYFSKTMKTNQFVIQKMDKDAQKAIRYVRSGARSSNDAHLHKAEVIVASIKEMEKELINTMSQATLKTEEIIEQAKKSK